MFVPMMFGCADKKPVNAIKIGDFNPPETVVRIDTHDSAIKYVILNVEYKNKEDSIEILYLRTGNNKLPAVYGYFDSLKVLYGKLAGRWCNQ